MMHGKPLNSNRKYNHQDLNKTLSKLYSKNKYSDRLKVCILIIVKNCKVIEICHKLKELKIIGNRLIALLFLFFYLIINAIYVKRHEIARLIL